MSITADRFAGIRVGIPSRLRAQPAVSTAAPRAVAGAVDGISGTVDGIVAATRPVTWSTVDLGFHVASRAGEFVGSIDSTEDGHFIAFDGTSSPIGRYPTLMEAKRAVTSWVPERARQRDRELARVFEPIATSASVVAIATALIGALSTVMPG